MRSFPLPASLRDSAVQIEGLAEPGWHRDALPTLFRALLGSTVAVVGVTVHLRVPWGFAPTALSWSCVRRHGELAMDFAIRSRGTAEAYVNGLWSDDLIVVKTQRGVPRTAGPDGVVFVVSLDGQDVAGTNVASTRAWRAS